MSSTGQARSPMTPTLRSALMAGAFAKWQQRYHPYPVMTPAEVQKALPVSVGRAKQILDHAWQNGGEAGKRACWCVDRMLRSCDHPEHHRVFRGDAWHNYEPNYGDARIKPEAVSEPSRSWVDTDIEFDSNNYATKVTVWSAFTGFPEGAAREFIRIARPPNWSERSDLFKKTVPGSWDPARGVFTKTENNPGLEYFIYEQAEWDWSPEVNGGLVNILSIKEQPDASLESEHFKQLADEVFEQLLEEAQDDGEQQKAERLQRLQASLWQRYRPSTDLMIRYTYGLHRCLQSRFIGSWKAGGLTLDDGEYKAAWFPPQDPAAESQRAGHGLASGDGAPGLLCINVTKSLLFSRQADVYADYSKVLNVLAPALASLLMEQLAHDGVLEFLADWKKTRNLS